MILIARLYCHITLEEVKFTTKCDLNSEAVLSHNTGGSEVHNKT